MSDYRLISADSHFVEPIIPAAVFFSESARMAGGGVRSLVGRSSLTDEAGGSH